MFSLLNTTHNSAWPSALSMQIGIGSGDRVIYVREAKQADTL